MSGDVFGNGMLLSNLHRLVARSTTATSSSTRSRLVDLLRGAQAALRAACSSWQDYDKSLISGGVYPVSKSINISPRYDGRSRSTTRSPR